jgi:hypothetical protein
MSLRSDYQSRITSQLSPLTAALAAQRFQDLLLAFSPGASRSAFGISYSRLRQAYGAAGLRRAQSSRCRRPRKRLLAAKMATIFPPRAGASSFRPRLLESVFLKIRPRQMKLLGVDIGFSEKRRSTAIACLNGDELTSWLARTDLESRTSKIPDGFRASVIALDGPLLPAGAPETIRRPCEAAFIRAPFHKRCKPGLSHWGLGLMLRNATGVAFTQFCRFVEIPELDVSDVTQNGPIIEAFPNAFLGVLTPEPTLRLAPIFKRGRRFDWLYDTTVSSGNLELKLSKELDLPAEMWRRLRVEKHHERRAALICLLTAAIAARGTATVVGEAAGGWFWLPPWSSWEPWAKEGLQTVLSEMGKTAVLSAPHVSSSHRPFEGTG